VDTYPVVIDRIEIQHIKNIMTRLIPLLPLRHLHRTQIMRRIHITCLPPSRNLLAQIHSHIMVPQFLDVVVGAGSASGSSFALFLVGYLEEACDGPAGGAVSGQVLHLGVLNGVGEGWRGLERRGRG